VGTEREPLCIVTSNYAFIGPNNGLFETILKENPDHQIYEISKAYLTGKPHTFHGRDLFVPAAVDFFKKNLQHFTSFDEAKVCKILPTHQAIIIYIDSFGNIKTNKSLESGEAPDVNARIKGETYRLPFVKTFKNVAVGELLCYRGSNNTLEIAVNQGSAAQKLNVQVGDGIDFET
jgi:S-adenosyl-L-methionine hydrolase (adenosine-forming)